MNETEQPTPKQPLEQSPEDQAGRTVGELLRQLADRVRFQNELGASGWRPTPGATTPDSRPTKRPTQPGKPTGTTGEKPRSKPSARPGTRRRQVPASGPAAPPRPTPRPVPHNRNVSRPAGQSNQRPAELAQSAQPTPTKRPGTPQQPKSDRARERWPSSGGRAVGTEKPTQRGWPPKDPSAPRRNDRRDEVRYTVREQGGPQPQTTRPVPRATQPTNKPEPRSEVGLVGREALAAIRRDLGPCQRCGLAGGRTNIVFGVGNESADLMFVGEAPGYHEDKQGEPFVGKAGALLTKMIGAMGLRRSDVYIANIIKCRPPNNRDPEIDEVDACEPFLRRQIDVIKPLVIVSLGRVSASTLLRTRQGITRLRGRWQTYHGVKLMPTFHPAYLLRNPAEKRRVWEDLQAVMKELNLSTPDR